MKRYFTVDSEGKVIHMHRDYRIANRVSKKEKLTVVSYDPPLYREWKNLVFRGVRNVQ